MINILVALLLTLAFLAVAAGFTLTSPSLWSPEIASDCFNIGLDPGQCTEAALRVGLYSSTTFALAGILCLAAERWWRKRHAPLSITLPPAAVSMVMAASALVITAHLLARHFGQEHASRIADISDYSTFISLENLLWPLLVQMSVLETRVRERLGLIGLLTAIMSLTPYRTALVTIMLFAFAIPIIEDLWRGVRTDWSKQRLGRLALLGGLAVLLSAGTLWSVYIDRIASENPLLESEILRMNRMITQEWSRDSAKTLALQTRRIPTKTRTPRVAQPNDTPKPSMELSEEEASRLTVLPRPVRKLAQRVVTPLFQAAALEQLGRSQPLPSILDEIKRKFRLSSSLSLNEYLYQKLYGGYGTGQTTALYYGEAIAYFPSMPLLWMVGGPLFIGLCWIWLRSKIIDAPTLFAVALWRSSMAGLVTILPALLIQAGILTAMAASARYQVPFKGGARFVEIIKRSCLVILTLTLFFQARESQIRDNTWNLAIASPRPDCWLTSLNDYLPEIDQGLRQQGIRVHSAVGGSLLFFQNRPVLAMAQIPDGMRAKAWRPMVEASLKPLLECAPGLEQQAPMIVSDWVVPMNGSLPLYILAALLLLACLFPWRRLKI